MAFTFIDNSHLISSGIEYFMLSDSTSKTDQTDDCIVEAWIDGSAASSITIKVYEKINGGTQRVLLVSFNSPSNVDPVIIPALILGEGWEISYSAAGSVTIQWSIRKITGGTLTFTNNSASIGGTEFFLMSNSTTKTDQTNVCLLQSFIDFGNLQAGDSYVVKLYETINSVQKVVFERIVNGAQAAPFIHPMHLVGTGWEVSIQKLTGTDRTINWSLRQAA